MPPNPYDPFDPGMFLDFLGTEKFPRYAIGNWKMRLWWSGNKWVQDHRKSKLFNDFVAARDEAWDMRVSGLRFPEQ
jgi:hypothetical protein